MYLHDGCATARTDATVVDSTAEPLGLERPRSPGCAGWHTYVRRQPEGTVLHQVVREHLETFLAETRLRGGGGGLPRFVERELREFLTCGSMARGFARFRCSGSCSGSCLSVRPWVRF